jgi:hypothetical protein
MPRKPAFLRPEGASPCPEAVKCAVGFALIEALSLSGNAATEDGMIGKSEVGELAERSAQYTYFGCSFEFTWCSGAACSRPGGGRIHER